MESLFQNTYMDDSIDSRVKQLKGLWRKAGMHPRNWLPKSKKVLAEINRKDRARQIDLSMNDLPSVKTLAVTRSSSSL